MNIARTTLTIDESLDLEIKNHLNNYWKFQEGKFINSPKSYCENEGLNIYDFRKILNEFSTFKITYYCPQCSRRNTFEGRSQNDFKVSINGFKKFKDCPQCKTELQQTKKRFQRHSKKLYSKAYLKAIESKVWRKLPKDELQFLVSFFDFDHYTDFICFQEGIEPYTNYTWDLIKKLEKMKILYIMMDHVLWDLHILVNSNLENAMLQDLKKLP